MTISTPTTRMSPSPAVDVPRPSAAPSFLKAAKLIGILTLLSRFFGLGREMVAGHYLGTALVGSAFSFAFVVPNLFRKLFGEGALSAAFIPLYAQALQEEKNPKHASLASGHSANDFAAHAVNLLITILIGLTVAGEAIIAVFLKFVPELREDRILMLKLTAIMLPYVVLICGGAFLSGILQVHRRFAAPAAAPIILNACHILVLLIGAKIVGLSNATPAGLVTGKQITLSYWLAVVVLIAGVLQVLVLIPGLTAVGFRFRAMRNFWTPQIKRMLLLSLPVALGAGVLQMSVFLDKGISYCLMQGVDSSQHLVKEFSLLGHVIRLPMEIGAPRRLDFAQFLYQFPLGIFAIALATAIFPSLSADALNQDREQFRRALRHGIQASLWEGLPASLGLILVADPVSRLLFEHGQVDGHSAMLIARSTMIYSGAIWAFSLLQIINRAFYSLQDTRTPLVMSIVNIALNLVVEIPLLWTRLGESALAVGTLVSFTIQTIVMVWILDRKIDGLNLQQCVKPVGKMLLATVVMGLICAAVKLSPLYPHGMHRITWLEQLTVLLLLGGGSYLLACRWMGVTMLGELFGRKKRRTAV